MIEYYIKEYNSTSSTSSTSSTNDNGNLKINRNPKTLEEAKTSKESYYYYLRNIYNNLVKENKECNKLQCSALFIILNKTCFRGLYREGPNGFNVPFGHYKTTPKIITKEELYSISNLIQGVIFVSNCFTKVIKNFKKGDFVYLDPPYAPVNSKSFVNYVSDGFNLEMHKKLFEEVKLLNDKKIKFLMSNSKVKLVTDNFDKDDFNYQDILAKRTINSKKPNSVIIEVLISN